MKTSPCHFHARHFCPPARWLRRSVRLLGLMGFMEFADDVFSATLVWTNTAGGNWSTASNWSPNGSPGSADTAVITNSGTYTVTFNITSTFTVGGLQLGGSSGQQTLLIPDTVSNLTLSGTSVIDTNGAVTGDGLVIVGGNGTLISLGTHDIGRLKQAGFIRGSGVLNVTNTFEWAGGIGRSISTNDTSAFVFNTTATAQTLLGSVFDITFDRVTWNQMGTLIWSNTATVTINNNAVINNSGLWDARGNDVIQRSAGTGSFNNTGTFRKSAGTGSTLFSSPVLFTNVSGTVESIVGNIQFNTPFVQTGGSTLLKGGTLGCTTPLQILGGVLGGTNTITASVNNVGGTLSPGASPGLLNITGNYTQAVAGVMSIEIAGLTAGTQFDKLAVSGIAQLNGALNIIPTNGFSPPSASTYQFLTAAGVSNNFASINYPSNQLGLRVTNSATSRTIQIINTPPRLNTIAAQTIPEMALFQLTPTMVDDESATQTPTFSLTNSPAGASINPSSGQISWTPTETDGPGTNQFTVVVTDNGTNLLVASQTFFVTVNEVNIAPVLTLPANQTLDELTALSVNATATDADLPANALTFALVSGPSGLTVGTNGAISWTPTEAQGPSTNTVTVKVTDLNPDALVNQTLSATNSFQVIVREVNTAPVLTVPADQTLDELTALSVNATATDADLPANALTFALISGPGGLTVGANGAINWTPTEAQVPSTNTVTVSVTDFNAAALVNQTLSTTNSFQLVVLALPADRFWINSEGGTYQVAANWSPNSVPLPQNNAVFTNDASYQVNWTADATVAQALFNAPGGTVTQSVGGFAWTVTNRYVVGENPGAAGGVAHVSGRLAVKNAGGDALLELRQGTNTFNGGVIEADRLVQTNGSGRFTFNGGTLITRQATLLNSFAVGNTNGSEPATWIILSNGTPTVLSNGILIGLSAPNATLFITNGGVLNSRFSFIGSASSSSNNTVSVSGSSSHWQNPESLCVGSFGSFNSLLITDGGTVTNFLGSVVGQRSSSSHNAIAVSGPGSLLNTLGLLFVGLDGDFNTLQINNGGTVRADGVTVGSSSSSVGNRLTVAGGTLVSATDLDIRRGTNVFDFGLIDVGRLLLTNTLGTFEFTGGTLNVRTSTVANAQAFIVGNGALPATMNLAGNGSHAFANGLILRSNAMLAGNGIITGTLTVQAGGTVAPGNSVGKITLSNSPSFSGTLLMEIGKNGGALTNDVLALASGVLTYGGTLTVTNIGLDALALGNNFRLFAAANYAGSFATVVLPVLDAGLTWSNRLALDGSIQIVNMTPPTPPLFDNIIQTSGSIVIIGSGGTPGGTYIVLGSVDLSLPVSSWTPVQTNVFDGSGNFIFTNLFDPASPQNFFRISSP